MSTFNFEVKQNITTLNSSSITINDGIVYYNGPYYYEIKIIFLLKGTCYIGLKSNNIMDEDMIKEKIKELNYNDYIFHSFQEIDEKDFKNVYPKQYNCG